MRLRAQVATPQFPSLEIITMNSRRTEPCNDSFSVHDRRRGTRRVFLAGGFFLRRSHTRLPEQPPVLAIETHDGAAMLFFNRLGNENAAVPRDRRRNAALRQGRAPTHVFVRAPVQGQSRLL